MTHPGPPRWSPLSGLQKLQLFRRVGEDWHDLAVVCEIPVDRLTRGFEAHDIWDWLERRGRLSELPTMLAAIGRRDLVEFLEDHAASTVSEPDAQRDGTERWWIRSGHQLVNHAPRIALSLLRWELAARPDDELTCRLAEALYRVGDWATAEQVAEAALEQVTQADLIVDLLWTLAQCRALRGRSQETLDRLRRALSLPQIGRRQRARLLVLAARVYRSMGDVEEACRAAEEALREATEADDRWAVGWALGVLSLIQGVSGNTAAALPLFDQALTVAADQPELADLRLMLLVNRAVALSDVDRYAEAIAAAKQARSLATTAGNHIRAAQAGSVLAELWFDTGQWDAALRQVENRNGDMADPGVRCNGHGIAALIGLHRNDPAAYRHLAEAEEFAARLDRRLVGSILLAKALAQEQAGAPHDALKVLLDGISAAAADVSEVLGLLADTMRLAIEVGEGWQAESIVEQAQAVDRPGSAVSNHCRGLLDNDPARLGRAALHYHRAGRLLPSAQAWEAAGAAAADRGDPGQARLHSDKALRVYQALGARWDIARLNGERRQPPEERRTAA
jgi:tetratricopeptide (TPR) repeat protein